MEAAAFVGDNGNISQTQHSDESAKFDEENPLESVTILSVKVTGDRSRWCPELGGRERGYTRRVARLLYGIKLHGGVDRFRHVMLSFDPQGYSGPDDLFERCRCERYVSEFIRRLSRRFKGRKIHYAKYYEFHKSGWVHVHVILSVDGRRPGMIGHALLEGIWDRGWVSETRVGKDQMAYAAKGGIVYAAKGVFNHPDWMDRYDQCTKLASSSRGFCGDPLDETRELSHEDPKPREKKTIGQVRALPRDTWRTKLVMILSTGEQVTRTLPGYHFPDLSQRLLGLSGAILADDSPTSFKGVRVRFEGGGMVAADTVREAGGGGRPSLVQSPDCGMGMVELMDDLRWVLSMCRDEWGIG